MHFLFSETKHNLLQSQQQTPSETVPQCTKSWILQHSDSPHLEGNLNCNHL